jgi:hypothetical protein
MGIKDIKYDRQLIGMMIMLSDHYESHESNFAILTGSWTI